MVQTGNIAAMRRREPEAIRTSLRLVLNGSPRDRPLFTLPMPSNPAIGTV